MFDATRIQSATDVQRVEVFSRLASTNDRALALIRRECPVGSAVIVAEQQTAGRGQRDRKWWSGEGSLTFSWIAPRIKTGVANEQSKRLLPFATALAIVEAIASLNDLTGIKVKWPNDLLVNNRKLCGILIETVSRGTDDFPVVGIGINVNNQNIDRAHIDSLDNGSGQATSPTSILSETGHPTELEDLLIAVIQQLEAQFELANTNPDSIVERCNLRLAFFNQPVDVILPGGNSLQGTCLGIAIDGGLVIGTETGDVTVYSGSISGK